MPTEDRDYHIDRARTELDRAFRTDNRAAARAHFGLASLHMKLLREADGRPTEHVRKPGNLGRGDPITYSSPARGRGRGPSPRSGDGKVRVFSLFSSATPEEDPILPPLRGGPSFSRRREKGIATNVWRSPAQALVCRNPKGSAPMSLLEAAAGRVPADRADRAFLGHPKGLGYLAFAEGWERFSYYGMQALLVLYMTQAAAAPRPCRECRRLRAVPRGDRMGLRAAVAAWRSPRRSSASTRASSI